MANYFDWILQNPGLNHISIKIFENLDIVASLESCLQVSQQWNQFIKENESIWRKHLTKSFPLHHACRLGHVYIVKLLIEMGFDVNARDTKVGTPLSIACKTRNVKLAMLLCQQPKIDVNENFRLDFPLNKAFKQRNMEIFEILCKHPKIDINRKFWCSTILIWVCREWESQNFVKILLQVPNIDVNFQDNNGDTALHLACGKDQFDTVELLLKHPSININSLNNRGETPLDECMNRASFFSRMMKEKLDSRNRIVQCLKELGAKQGPS